MRRKGTHWLVVVISAAAWAPSAAVEPPTPIRAGETLQVRVPAGDPDKITLTFGTRLR